MILPKYGSFTNLEGLVGEISDISVGGLGFLKPGALGPRNILVVGSCQNCQRIGV